MHARINRQLARLRQHRASVLTIAAVTAMFACSLLWLQAHAPHPASLRAVAGTSR